MAIAKRKDMDWQSYLQGVVESESRLSDVERIEFSGYLLRRDMENSINRAAIFQHIMATDNFFPSQLIEGFLIAESPDSVFDLTQGLKYVVVEYYRKEADRLIEAAITEYQETRRRNMAEEGFDE